MAIFRLDGTHYTTYIYEVNETVAHYADSLGHPPSHEVMDAINAFIEPLNLRTVSHFVIHEVARQGFEEGGAGSCGMAALNFAQTYGPGDSMYPKWYGGRSQAFRMGGLYDLVITHHVSAQRLGTARDWVEPCNPSPSNVVDDGPDESFVFGYGDFNMYKPKVC
ncbi:hypothetical protein FA13DRAFT_1624680 [Coprinellus micaceus]|uniref:Uncharacterized protein n=1 Tax=Coprinellus micaceus TaxID=71717 RepID=A0A4Y7SZ34_COPMI|nr:hypothetical protein FA13DRAFT_1635390 [Coprinellus micaceus]TEB35808.1 hypothetical protein FA13DRAFT_1624680 [Coprinellus micaceus]